MVVSYIRVYVAANCIRMFGFFSSAFSDEFAQRLAPVYEVTTAPPILSTKTIPPTTPTPSSVTPPTQHFHPSPHTLQLPNPTYTATYLPPFPSVSSPLISTLPPTVPLQPPDCAFLHPFSSFPIFWMFTTVPIRGGVKGTIKADTIYLTTDFY
jgi:hypothetical protein